MRPALSRRIARALDIGQATPAERRSLVAAAQRAQTFAALPPDMQRLLRRLEAGPSKTTPDLGR